MSDCPDPDDSTQGIHPRGSETKEPSVPFTAKVEFCVSLCLLELPQAKGKKDGKEKQSGGNKRMERRTFHFFFFCEKSAT